MDSPFLLALIGLALALFAGVIGNKLGNKAAEMYVRKNNLAVVDYEDDNFELRRRNERLVLAGKLLFRAHSDTRMDSEHDEELRMQVLARVLILAPEFDETKKEVKNG